MEAVGELLAWVGAVVAVTGAILLLIRAFQVSVFWGLITLVPMGVFIFAAAHWEKAKQGFAIMLAGAAASFFGRWLAGSL